MTENLFAVGVINAKLSSLFNYAILQNFKNLSPNKFIELLKHYAYGDEGDDFDRLMLAEELKTKKFLTSLFPYNYLLFKVMYLKFDVLFLASLIKDKLYRLDNRLLLRGLSTFDEQSLLDYVYLGQDITLSLDDKTLIDELLLSTKGLSPQEISDLIVKKLTDQIAEEIKATDEYLQDYHRFILNIENVLLFIRSRRFQKDQTYLNNNFLLGSDFVKNNFMAYYSLPLNEFLEYLKIYFPTYVLEVLKKEDSTHYLTEVGEVFEEYKVEYLKSLAFDLTSFAPALNYLFLKHQEIFNLKKLYLESMEQQNA